MSYTLVSHGRALGTTGAELPASAPGMRSWHFLPGPAFAEARPLFAALPAAIEDSQEVIPTQGELEAIPEASREQWMRELLRSDPRMTRFMELSAQLEALDLALVDADGRSLGAQTIGVTVLDLSPEAFREVLVRVDASAERSAVLVPPFYLLVAELA